MVVAVAVLVGVAVGVVGIVGVDDRTAVVAITDSGVDVGAVVGIGVAVPPLQATKRERHNRIAGKPHAGTRRDRQR
jgi:putative N-acetylmannosamine-6-phosphate epimerase